MKKKAIEMSVNFLVIIILAVVIFGFGIYISNKIFSKAGAAKDQLDSQTREQIENLLQSGEKVIIPRDYETVDKGESAVFGIGILNTDTNEDFEVIVEKGDAYEETGGPIPNKLEWKIRAEGAVEIEQNKKEVMSLAVIVQPDAASGTHILNVYICHDFGDITTSNDCTRNGYAGRLYDDTVHKIHVVVP